MSRNRLRSLTIGLLGREAVVWPQVVRPRPGQFRRHQRDPRHMSKDKRSQFHRGYEVIKASVDRWMRVLKGLLSLRAKIL